MDELTFDVPMTVVMKTLPIESVAPEPKARQARGTATDAAAMPHLRQTLKSLGIKGGTGRMAPSTGRKPTVNAVQKAQREIDAETDPVRKAELANQLSLARLTALYEARGAAEPVAKAQATSAVRDLSPIVRERAELVQKAAEERDPVRAQQLSARVNELNHEVLKRALYGGA